MVKTVLFILLLAMSAQAGVLRVCSYPFRVSPVKLFTPVVHVITFPAFHPVRTGRVLLFPALHPVRFWVLQPARVPTTPPDLWANGVIVGVAGEF